jgi:UDP-N-acetylmuramoyl-tripeptide--D-alanyl-D-alanine ligase
MTLNLQDAARAMEAAGAPPPSQAAGWSVDTRTQNPGDVYFALRGTHCDGHDFVPAAVEKGASAVVVERSTGQAKACPTGQAKACPTVELLVPDSLKALQGLAAWARRKWAGPVVAVTGSAGKTTTKDAIASLLSVAMPVGKTVGNFNNHVGVPLSILRLPDGCRAAAIEMGMNHAGEIRELAAIAGPDMGVVTNVGYAHVEFFDSIDGVAAAKRELIEALPRDGVAFLNADDPRVLGFRDAHAGRTVTFGFSEGADVRSEGARFHDGGSHFRVQGVDFETSQPGRHAVMNLLAAIAVAGEFGIAPERLRDAVRGFTTSGMRGVRLERNGVVVWNDCYNSNPEAAESMIDVLRETPAARRIAVLGEMRELGQAAGELHRRVGRYAAARGVDLLIGVQGEARAMVEAAREAGLGPGAALYFEDAAEAGGFARQAARPGDAALFKGSRGVRMERALERFLE